MGCPFSYQSPTALVVLTRKERVGRQAVWGEQGAPWLLSWKGSQEFSPGILDMHDRKLCLEVYVFMCWGGAVPTATPRLRHPFLLLTTWFLKMVWNRGQYGRKAGFPFPKEKGQYLQSFF